MINGIASSIEGGSYVTVNKSSNEEGYYRTEFLPGCKVKFVSGDKNIDLIEGFDRYYVPNDFKVNKGETWELKIVLPNGKEYRSSPETLIEEVLISDIESKYDLELFYDEPEKRFAPGHKILISFQEPPDNENYYYYEYKSYETEAYCIICNAGVLRNGECLSTAGIRWARPYFTYNCDSPCWKIRVNEKIKIFDDEFTNGKFIENLEVAEVPLYSKRDILVELQQYSISYDAYKYYKSIKDLVENNGGLNAPLPSVLIGNLYNTIDEDEIVLGRFTVASGSSKSIYIPRRKLAGNDIRGPKAAVIEKFGDRVPQPLSRFDYPIFASCDEGAYRTGIKPLNWPDNE